VLRGWQWGGVGVVEGSAELGDRRQGEQPWVVTSACSLIYSKMSFPGVLGE
jgi:hypothetical protein